MSSFLEKAQVELSEFANEREWERFHQVKNLSMALAVEASELMEIFQWEGHADITQRLLSDSEFKERVEDEVADIFAYLIRLTDKAGIDLEKSFKSKMEKNRKKYPAEKVKGSARKYSDYKN